MGDTSSKLRTLAIILAGVLAAGSAHAQTQPDRTVEQFKCKDVMREMRRPLLRRWLGIG
jgi:hypothetical protein